MPTYIGMKYKTHAHASKGGSDLGELRVVCNKRHARHPQRLLQLPHLLLLLALPLASRRLAAGLRRRLALGPRSLPHS